MSEDTKNSEKQEERTRKPSFLRYIISKIKSSLSSGNNRLASKHRHRLINNCIEFISKYNLEPKLAIFAIAVLLSFFIFRDIADPHLDYRKGKIAQRHLIAKNTIEFIDKDTSEKKKKDLMDSVLSVYDFDQIAIVRMQEKIQNAFSNIRSNYPFLIRSKSPMYNKIMKDYSSVDQFYTAKESFSKDIGVDLKDSEFMSFIRIRFSKKFENTLPYIFTAIEEDYIVLSKEALDSEKAQGITVNHFNKPLVENVEKILKNFSQIIEVKDAKKKLISIGKKTLLGRMAQDENRALSVLLKMLSPNLTSNKRETEKRRLLIEEEYQPVMIKINRGDSIVRYGDKITDKHITVLKYLQEQRRKESSFLQFLFTVILLSILIYSLYMFNQGVSPLYEYSLRDMGVFLAIGIGIIVAIKGLQFIVIEAIFEKFPQIPIQFYYFVMPVAAGSAIVRMLTSRLPAFTFMIVMSVVCGILLERNFFFATYVLISSLVATTLSVRIKTRAVIYKMGFITALVNIIVITCITAHTRSAASLDLIWNDMSWIFWAGLLSGLLTSAVVVSFVPIIEYFLGYTTDLRLLELASMDHPLLRKLLVRAPGTYHHSMVIGSLVEKAAEDIQANPLLARVMSYYHDVGKMERPLYFIENQAGEQNRHDSLRPHMSAMIIRDHVKKGQELGRRYKLPKPIIDAMSEHHGNSIITYFYNKARKESDDPDSVPENDYRYEGQRPQSRESALVMLGDVVEAATRSLADPTPFRLSNVVRNILNKYFAEGHLAECDLTLRDLDQIAESFVQVLIGIYHARIDYGIPITSNIKGSKKNEEKNTSTSSKDSKRQPNHGSASKASGVKYISEAVRTSNTDHKNIKKR